MALKVYKATSPGRRQMSTLKDEQLTKKRPEKSLTEFHLRTGGRNNDGRQTIRFRGGGISGSIVRSISVATRPVSRRLSSLWNTIRTVRPELPCCTIETAKSGTSLLRLV